MQNQAIKYKAQFYIEELKALFYFDTPLDTSFSISTDSRNIEKEQILFLDVETVPLYKDYTSIPENKKKFWDHKSKLLAKLEQEDYERLIPEEKNKLYERAGIFSEFGKIICISSGFLKSVNGNTELQVKSIYNHDERTVLSLFLDILKKLEQGSQKWFLCAHNGKEFDFPYLCRRMVVNGLPIPGILDLAGKKPWEVFHLDTMELWKFGDYKSYASLDLLADIFNIPSPKDDLDGSKVRQVYYEDNNLERIAEYCSKDVITLAQVLMRYKGEPFILAENIKMVP